MYLLFNKNRVAWNFVRPKLEVTWCTVAIIMQVVLLSPYLCICGVSLSSKKKNYEFVSKAKIELHLFQQYFPPHTPPLKQGESENTPSPDLPSTRIKRSTIPFRKCFKSCSPVSDLVTRYSPQTTTRFKCLVLVPFEHEPSKSECR